MPLILETERLQLRPVTMSDLDRLHEIFVEPGVRKYLCDDKILAPEDVAAFIRQSSESFINDRHGLWALVPRSTEKTEAVEEDGQIIGACGYWSFHEPPELELLYMLSQSHWGAGLAVEASRAVMRYGFGHLGLARIQASTDTPNVASIRVMEKLGMSFLKREVVNGLPTTFYSITPEAFAHHWQS